MGLFGFNAEKKLAQARKAAAEGKLYDAVRAFTEVAERAEQTPLQEAARNEGREVRRRMIEARLEEANARESAGDLPAAKDRLTTALDLCEDDLPRETIAERLRALEAPRRPAKATGAEAEPDLLLDALEDPARGAVVAEPTDPGELYGEDPGAEFSLVLNTLQPEIAALFEEQGEAFQLGFLALTRGAPRAAMAQFDRMDWSAVPPPVALERGRALLLARRPEESLAFLDGIPWEVPERHWLRVEALRDLGRVDDAVAAAAELVNALPENTIGSDALLAWTLIEAGRPAEAHEQLEGWLQSGASDEEVLVPAAQALAMMEREAEAIQLLESLIQYRLESSLSQEREPNFPVQAGRRLVSLYGRSGRPPSEYRALLMHLLDFDPERGEQYRGLLLRA